MRVADDHQPDAMLRVRTQDLDERGLREPLRRDENDPALARRDASQRFAFDAADQASCRLRSTIIT
jgi:hypothetical protein